MKNLKFFILAALATFCLHSCEKESNPPVINNTDENIADIEEESFIPPEHVSTSYHGCFDYSGYKNGAPQLDNSIGMNIWFSADTLVLDVFLEDACCKAYFDTLTIKDSTVTIHIDDISTTLCYCICHYHFRYKFVQVPAKTMYFYVYYRNQDEDEYSLCGELIYP